MKLKTLMNKIFKVKNYYSEKYEESLDNIWLSITEEKIFVHYGFHWDSYTIEEFENFLDSI